MTVLPSPAPPKRPILPPRTNGVSRSTTLIPVSNCSVLGESASNAGGSRWIGQRSCGSDRPAAVDRVAQQVEDPAQRLLADRHAHRAAGIDHRHAAHQAVGRAQGHAAHPVAAQVLLHLAGQVDLDALDLAVDPQGVVNVRQMPFVELGVEGRADHLGDSSVHGRGGHGGHSFKNNGLLFESTRGPDDVGQLARDLVLPGTIVLPRERLDEVVGVLGGPAHRDHAGDLLADGRVEEALEQAAP